MNKKEMVNRFRLISITTTRIFCVDCGKKHSNFGNSRIELANVVYALGWCVIDGRVLCPECAGKGKGDE
jgi:hypothetical protein